MLQVTIPSIELYDEINETFITSKEQTLQLEHSLVSISKWESKWKKPFLSKEDKTIEEMRDYVKCMTLAQKISDDVYARISPSIIFGVIQEYIMDSMTATTFSSHEQKKTNREVITAEIIYYYMIAMQIPFECQKWHLNRLITLINICDIKNRPPSKMSRKEIINRNKALNDARRKSLNTKG